MFRRNSLLAVLVFVGSCLLLQCGTLRLSPVRHCALWLLAASVGTLLLLALAVLCGEAGRAFTWILGRRRFRYGAFTLSALVIAAAAAIPFTYPTPGEPIIGAADEGIYLSSAIHLARTGSYRIEVPILRETTSALQPWMLGYEPAEAQRRSDASSRFWNYHTGFVLDPQPPDERGEPAQPISSEATINPQFPPGFPVLLAAAYDVGGWRGLSIANRILMILAAALLGLLANRWLPAHGVIGLCVFLLALYQPLNLWAGRSYFAEPSALCLWLLAMLAWARRRLPGAGNAGLLTGAALAAGLYLKFDTLLVGSLTVLGVFFSSGRRFKIAFWIACASVGLSALLAWGQFSWPNFSGNIAALGQSRMLWFLAAGGLLAVGWKWRETRRRPGHDTSSQLSFLRYSPFVLALALLILAAYAYWIRPNPGEAEADRFFFWPIEGMLRSYREETFFRLGWYWQPFGLALAVSGVALLGFRLRGAWQKVFFWSGLVSLVILSYDLRNNPLQPYAMRRLLTAAMPLLILGAAASFPLLWEGLLRFRRHWGSRMGRMVSAGLALAGTAALLAGFGSINHRLNTEPKKGNFGGLMAQTSQLADLLPPHSVVVIRRNTPLASLAIPLQVIEGIDIILLSPASHSNAYQAAFTRAWQEWVRRGRPVFLLSSVTDDRLDLFGVSLTSRAQGTIRFPLISQSSARLNTGVIEIEWDYFLQEIQLPLPEKPVAP
jgi:hypothetical protein